MKPDVDDGSTTFNAPWVSTDGKGIPPEYLAIQIQNARNNPGIEHVIWFDAKGWPKELIEEYCVRINAALQLGNISVKSVDTLFNKSEKTTDPETLAKIKFMYEQEKDAGVGAYAENFVEMLWTVPEDKKTNIVSDIGIEVGKIDITKLKSEKSDLLYSTLDNCLPACYTKQDTKLIKNLCDWYISNMLNTSRKALQKMYSEKAVALSQRIGEQGKLAEDEYRELTVIRKTGFAAAASNEYYTREQATDDVRTISRLRHAALEAYKMSVLKHLKDYGKESATISDVVRCGSDLKSYAMESQTSIQMSPQARKIHSELRQSLETVDLKLNLDRYPVLANQQSPDRNPLTFTMNPNHTSQLTTFGRDRKLVNTCRLM